MTENQIFKWAHFAKEQGYSSLNADPYKICYEFGIDIIERNIDNDGYLICEKGHKFIIVNHSIQNKHRKKFIIAHEIGHFLMHSDLLYCCKNLNDSEIGQINSNDQEQQANAFSSELLLPKDELIKNLNSSPISFSDVSKLANQFDVSMTMAARKMIKYSKSQKELLLAYNDGDLLWYATNNSEFRYKASVKKYTNIDNLYSILGEPTVWKKRNFNDNNQIEEFRPYHEQKLILIPDVSFITNI